jgi:hypothetical protein
MIRPGVYVVAVSCAAAAIVGVGVGVGAADGQTARAAKHKPAGKHKPSAYHAKGHSNIYATDGQVCFLATWQGNGGWSTDYRSTSTGPAPGQSASATDQDSSSYSWDAKSAPRAGVCGFLLIEGFKPHPIESFDAGFLRLAIMGDDKSEATNTTPTHETCNKALITHGSGGQATGSFTSKVRGNSLVFDATVDLGEAPTVQSGCATYALPGSLGVARGAFLAASSVAVPIAVFKTARSVSVTLSSDPSSVPHPNCSLPTRPRAGAQVNCTEQGSWQGTLTFTVYHG